ncbi:hypothetical protein ES705_10936 [subsurface metagenome]
MTQIIIVSKTHMSNAACIGALAINGRFLRLLDEDGYNQPTDTDFEVRQVWKIEFEEREQTTPPHVEDVLITSKKRKGTLKNEITMLQIVERFNAPIWRGSPDVIFDGKLQWTDSGSGYIPENGEIPERSVGFWISDKNLIKRIFYEKTRYNYPNINGWRSLPYVGYSQAVESIPTGTLVRVSLARWWDRDGETEKRCSLQLSGWYDLPEPIQVNQDEDDDLPF